MDRNEWYRAGEDIRDQVQQAVDTGNFTNLGKNIGDTVNETINRTMREVGRTVGTVGESVNRAVNDVGNGIGRAVESVGESISHASGGRGRGLWRKRRLGRRTCARKPVRESAAVQAAKCAPRHQAVSEDAERFCIRRGVHGSRIRRDGHIGACAARFRGRIGCLLGFRRLGSGGHIGDFYRGGTVARLSWIEAGRAGETL